MRPPSPGPLTIAPVAAFTVRKTPVMFTSIWPRKSSGATSRSDPDAEDAGVGDGDVEAAEASCAQVDGRHHLVEVGHVGPHRRARPTAGLDQPDRLVGVARVDVDHAHGGAVARQAEADSPADARSAARHDRDLTVECAHVPPPMCSAATRFGHHHPPGVHDDLAQLDRIEGGQADLHPLVALVRQASA